MIYIRKGANSHEEDNRSNPGRRPVPDRLTACGGSKTDSSAADNSSAAGDDKTITVGATPTPHAEILNAAKDALELRVTP